MVRKTVGLAICLVLVSTFLSVALFADSHRFELLKTGKVNEVTLKPGRYTLELEGDHLARIHRGKKLLVESKVEVHPLGGAMPESVIQFRDGRVKEIRLKQERVVFVDSSGSAQTAR